MSTLPPIFENIMKAVRCGSGLRCWNRYTEKCAEICQPCHPYLKIWWKQWDVVWVWGVGTDIHNKCIFYSHETHRNTLHTSHWIRINLTEQYTQTNQRPLVKLSSQSPLQLLSSSLVIYMRLDFIYLVCVYILSKNHNPLPIREIVFQLNYSTITYLLLLDLLLRHLSGQTRRNIREDANCIDKRAPHISGAPHYIYR